MEKIDIKSLSRQELERALEARGAETYRLAQIWRWLYKDGGAKSFDVMTDLPESLRRKLKEGFHITYPVMLDAKRSTRDGTTKDLLKLEDASTIETVFLPEANRNTVCLSTQVGCKFACSFCASAPFGFVRHLKTSEIVDEVLFVKGHNPSASITNIVFMGIGEPFDNYDNVIKSIRVLNDPDAFNIGARKITVSTCGLIPGIRRFAEEGLQVELSVSLHSADDKVRSHLVPINKRYPLRQLIAACREYTDRTNRVITFEYVLIKGANCSREDALKLARLLKGLKCKVNTIIYNKIRAKGFAEPSKEDVKVFLATLKESGVHVTNRKSRGEDIDAGCGQLRISRL
ncbi:MAG: 23S rRNA (adenine(2503)-C(2))-methyltransferase RlmN [Candidatus Omnitrophica bacterium]|nr:23S rRNA (adenine(2503)-C(2))-methyltransferase RlmN [Candidatus Omnitrophota bacterium]